MATPLRSGNQSTPRGKAAPSTNSARDRKRIAKLATKSLGEKDSRLTQKALQITTDRRFVEMDNYTKSSKNRLTRMIMTGDSSQHAHDYERKLSVTLEGKDLKRGTIFAREEISSAREQRRTKVDNDATTPEEDVQRLEEIDRVAQGECNNYEKHHREKFSGRIAWEESFRSNVKKLMVDVELATGKPTCSLNHLDRFHEWFQHEGLKQVAKERTAPSFLTFEKEDHPLPGSLRDGDKSPLGQTTLGLAGATRMRRSPRLETQIGAANPEWIPPKPGYK